MSLATLLGLIVCNVFWSGAYTISKSLMTSFNPLEVSIFRFVTAGVPMLIYCLLKREPGRKYSILGEWLRDLHWVDARIVAVGLLTFFVSPICQMNGLNMSRAMDGALLISTEPLFTILVACLVLREKLRGSQVFSIALAMAGAAVVTELTVEKVLAFKDSRMIGNALFMASLVCETAYSVIAKPVLDRRSPVLFMTVSLWVGIGSLVAFNLIADGPARAAGFAPLLASGSLADFGAAIYLGLGCTLFGYLFWMLALRNTPVSIMALTLYVQPVLGVLWGALFLHEVITVSTLVGGIMILGALFIASQPRRG